MPDAFGPFVSRGDIQSAVLALLQTPPTGGGAGLLVYYLAEAERLAGEPPRRFDPPATFRGGTDLEAYLADQLPAIVVVVEPSGRPERYGVGSYAQWFQVQVAAIVKAEDEEDARAFADVYGIAMAAVIAQHGGLGPSTVNPGDRFAIKTVLEAFPTIEFAVNAATSRNMLRTVVGFQTLVQPVLTEQAPNAFPHNPYTEPADLPLVETVDVEFTAVQTLP